MRLTPIALLAGALMLTACSANTGNDAPGAPVATAERPAITPPADAAATPSTTAVAPAGGMEGMSAEEHAAMDAGTAHTGAHPEGHEATASDQADGMAGMDHSSMPGMGQGAAAGGAQAGWYRGGTFQPCGSTQTYTVNAASDIDARIRAGKMSGTDPVYVLLEGSAANGAFNVTRVAQVGSPTPVRDCAMTGTTTQG